MNNPCQLPPRLQPGDLLRVVAPCGAMREFEAFYQGVTIWQSRGYQVEISTSIDKRWGYLAGTDEIRRHELLESWIDPNVKGILCARGGYGSARLLENWDWGDGEMRGGGEAGRRGEERFDVQLPITNYQLPKWLIGFSDVTGLLWSLYQTGISGVHGPLMTTIADEPDWSLQRLFNWVEKHELEPLKGIGWGGGKVSGILLPANFTVATHLLGTPIQPGLDNVILALEDVTEAPYRIDRMLTQWRLCGAFKKVRGIALGRFSRCEPVAGIPSFSVEEVLSDRLSDLSLPIISDLPFGHDGVNAALPVGIMAHLDADEGILSF
ncbi:LD-carboxypeptidase [Microseira sp. BLCC-F43]|uniref:S66 peptidase family protein n=1 Tax=Microseira sp. BLCC-F43 TaxID=3153602 RepID=UPI0035BA6653